MAEGAAGTVLKRKVMAGRERGGVPGPAQAFGFALAKAAQDLFRLPVTVLGAADLRASLAELPERLAEHALLAILNGPEEGLGLVALSPEVVATLIEIQTTHRIGPPQVAARRPTRTDAAMAMGFIDRFLQELESGLACHPAVIWAGGFRYGSFLEDPRPLGLILEDTGYRLLILTLGFGDKAARTGTCLLAVPSEGRGPAPQPAAAAGTAAGTTKNAVAGDWSGRLERAVLGAEAQVEAVLDRVSLPLAEVMALAPGMFLPFAAEAIRRVRVEGAGRRLLATGRLGQCEGHLAVRLEAAPSAADPDEPAEMSAVAFPMGMGDRAAHPTVPRARPDSSDPLLPSADPTPDATIPSGT